MVIIEYSTIHEQIPIEEHEEVSRIKLPSLNQEEKEKLNPLVPPTSGLRMEIYEIKNNNELFMPKENQFLFLRAFRAISEIAKAQIKKEKPGVLLVADDRPSSSYLLEFFAKILAYDKYRIFFQKPIYNFEKEIVKKDPYYSRMSTPYASASVGLFEEIDLVIVLTASHNGIIWNGIKFYIEKPIPISGSIMKAVSEKSLEFSEIYLKNNFQVAYLDANSKNNQYILKIVKEIINLDILSGKKVLLWPYMGTAPELQDLFHQVGMQVILVEEEMEPPNPTINLDKSKLLEIMKKNKVNTGILLDTDRDRIVFAIYDNSTNNLEIIQPNSLYTAMHNILSTKFKIPLVNVRTIPSDPRSDSNALLTFATGVGYKHLGIILYAAIEDSINNNVFQTAILYFKDSDGKYKKITSIEEIPLVFKKMIKSTQNSLIIALWEESGGHTFNILEMKKSNSEYKDYNHERMKNNIKLKAKYLPIGDKYPAEALLILTTLIEMGFDLSEFVDQKIQGIRSMIPANDLLKLRIVENFNSKIEQIYKIEEEELRISCFSEVNGKTAIIHLYNPKTDIYFRPSGTGPGVRIYIFGQKEKINKMMEKIKIKIDKEIPNE
ncbi:hypothetical protein [Candidatus Harpocratesius sp.]